MVGKILADTGGSAAIVETIVGKAGPRTLPWAMALIAAILGLPLFFEIGVVLLVPVVLLVARRTDAPVMRVGIPALAGLSVLHGLVPPHPGPLVAISNLHADLGQTLHLRPHHRRTDPGPLRSAAGAPDRAVGAGPRERDPGTGRLRRGPRTGRATLRRPRTRRRVTDNDWPRG